VETLCAYRFEIDLNDRQRTRLEQACWLARIVWNWGLAAREKHYDEVVRPARERGEKARSLTRFDQINAWNAVKDELCPWAREFSTRIPEHVLEHLDLAYRGWWRSMARKDRRVRRPKFKSRHTAKRSFRLRDSIHVDPTGVTLPRLGRLRIKGKATRVEGVIRFATLSERAGRWFVSLTVRQERPEPVSASAGAVGIDIGLHRSITLSTGEVIDSPRPLKSVLVRLRRQQKAVARSQRNSARRRKKVARVARTHARVANIRNHWLHFVSDRLTRTYAVIGHEKLALKNMAHKKRRLGRALADLGAGELFRQLAYKAAWRGVEIVVADRFYPSSQFCSSCGWRNPNLTLKDRVFHCSVCGLVIDRDHNAALNLKPVAVKPTETINARGGDIRPDSNVWQLPMRREPSTVIVALAAA
jgi:putative transposase